MRKTLDKIATLILRTILPLTAFLIPLFFLPLTPNFFDFNKNYLLFILASISLISFCLRSITRRQIQLTLSPASFPFFFLIIIFLLSSIFQSPNTHQALFEHVAPIISLIIIFITTTSSQKNKSLIKKTFYALIASSLITSLISIYQASDLNSFSSITWLQNKTFSPLGNPLSLITFLIPLLPAFIFLIFKTKSVWEKTFSVVTSIIIILALATQISFYLPPNQITQFILLPYTAGWSITVDIFKSLRTILLGVGPGNFINAFSVLRPISLNLTPYWNVRFNVSSSYILTLLTTTGILATISFLLAQINTLKQFKKTETKSPYLIASFIILAISSLTLLLLPSNTSLLTINFLSLSLVVLQLKIQSSPSIKDQVFSLVASSHQNTRKTPVLSLALSFFSFLLLIFFWIPATNDYLAARATYKAFVNLNQDTSIAYQELEKAYLTSPTNSTYRTNFAQTSLAIANNIAAKTDLTDEDRTQITQLIEQSIRESKNAIQLNPQNVIYWENLASVYNQLTNFAEGAVDWTIASYSQAIQLDPTNPELRLNLGGVYLSLSDNTQAIKLFEQAINLKSDWPNAHYNLAAAYKANQQYAPALQQMQIVSELIPPESADYQRVQLELKELQKLVPASTDQTNTQPDEEETQLITPTPIPSPTTNIDLPEDSGPDIPEENTETPTAEPTPTPEE